MAWYIENFSALPAPPAVDSLAEIRLVKSGMKQGVLYFLAMNRTKRVAVFPDGIMVESAGFVGSKRTYIPRRAISNVTMSSRRGWAEAIFMFGIFLALNIVAVNFFGASFSWYLLAFSLILSAGYIYAIRKIKFTISYSATQIHCFYLTVPKKSFLIEPSDINDEDIIRFHSIICNITRDSLQANSGI